MNYTKNGFSLVEIIVASGILTIAVFGVYKLISENTKIINTSGNFLQADFLFPVTQECIKNIGLNTFSGGIVGQKYNFSFGNSINLEGCSYNDGNKVILDNIEYEVSGEIKEKGIDYIKWDIQINSSETNTISKTYIQTK